MHGMRQWLLLVLLYLHCLVSVHGIYESQAGVLDWHHEWIGKPKEWVHKAHGLIVVTERNVLASLNPDTGALRWRHMLDEPLDKLHVTDHGVITVSGQGVRVRSWDTSGKLLWTHELGSSNDHSSILAAFWPGGQVASLNSTGVTKLSKDGEVAWTWERPKKNKEVMSTLVLVDNQLHVLEQGTRDSKFLVTTLEGETGDVLSTHTVSCTESSQLFPIGSYLAWKDRQDIRWNRIGTKKVHRMSLKQLVGSLPSFQTAQLESMVITPLGTSSKDDLFVVYTLLKRTGGQESMGDVQSAIALVGFKDNGQSLYVLRELGVSVSVGLVDATEHDISYASFVSTSEMEVRIVSRDNPFGDAYYTLPHDFTLTGNIVDTKLVSANPLVVLASTDSGSIHAYNATGLLWSREEALAHTSAAELVDLPEKQVWTHSGETMASPSMSSPLAHYLYRLKSHASQLRQFPTWLINHLMFFQTTSTKLQEVPTTTAVPACWTNTSETNDILYRDHFGLQKLVISVTDTGKVIAQDSQRGGRIVWSRYMYMVKFDHIFVVRTAATQTPLIVVTGRSSEGGHQATHFYRLNALNGQDYYSDIAESSRYFEPALSTEITIDKIMFLPIEEPEEKTRILAMFEASTNRVFIYPDTFASRYEFLEFIPTFYFNHRSRNGTFIGYKVVEGYRGSLSAEPVWDLVLPNHETMVATSERQPYERVASLGRVLGNRNVLYKYLNPNMMSILSSDKEAQTLVVRLVDTVKGSILYETVHTQVDTVHHGVHVIQAEHWVVYHYWSNDKQRRGYQVAVLELFEGEHEDERVVASNFSSYGPQRPHILSAAFAFPHAVKTVGVTTTRFGVSTRDILFGLDRQQIMGVNKRLLDPRRPLGKPTTEQQEEMLVPYAPIADERKAFLTHTRQVMGIRKLLSAPALLESTSLVYAYGLDAFFTPSSPSRQFDVLSETFSKSQLLLTIVGLVLGIFVARPMVQRKLVNALWK